MAALPLKPDGHLIVVGDHRQMPPIVKHDWDGEPRRTFKEFRSYESLFSCAAGARAADDPVQRELPAPRRHGRVPAPRDLRAGRHPLPLATRHLLPASCPIRRSFVAARARARAPAGRRRPRRGREPGAQPLRARPDRAGPGGAGRRRGLRPRPADGLGVVVPHRAQRAALQEAFPLLALRSTRDRRRSRARRSTRSSASRATSATVDPRQRHRERPRLPARLRRVPARPAPPDRRPQPRQAKDGPRRRPRPSSSFSAPTRRPSRTRNSGRICCRRPVPSRSGPARCTAMR